MNSQSEVPEEGPPAQDLHEHELFIDQVEMQPPIVQTIVIRNSNPIRKRVTIALAKLRAQTEQRKVANKLKHDAAMAKLQEEEEEILQLSQ